MSSQSGDLVKVESVDDEGGLGAEADAAAGHGRALVDGKPGPVLQADHGAPRQRQVRVCEGSAISAGELHRLKPMTSEEPTPSWMTDPPSILTEPRL